MAICRKLEFVFRINHNIKKSDIENLKNLFLFHGLLYYLSEKIIKIWGHRTNSLSGGPNLTPPLYVSCVLQYKKFRNAHFGHFDDAILLVYEAIKHLNVKKERKNTLKVGAHPGIDPGPLAL